MGLVLFNTKMGLSSPRVLPRAEVDNPMIEMFVIAQSPWRTAAINPPLIMGGSCIC
jgi:hypothetical protein